jgi:hypothetical protein
LGVDGEVWFVNKEGDLSWVRWDIVFCVRQVVDKQSRFIGR